MREPLLREQVVRLDRGLDVVAVDTDRDAHQHVLRPLHHLSVDLEQVGSLQRLYGKQGYQDYSLLEIV